MDEIIKIFVQVVLISIIFSLPVLLKNNLNGLKRISILMYFKLHFLINLILILSFLTKYHQYINSYLFFILILNI